jgi:hypothetical protein
MIDVRHGKKLFQIYNTKRKRKAVMSCKVVLLKHGTRGEICNTIRFHHGVIPERQLLEKAKNLAKSASAMRNQNGTYGQDRAAATAILPTATAFDTGGAAGDDDDDDDDMFDPRKIEHGETDRQQPIRHLFTINNTQYLFIG